jgi:hypothetical protein
MADGTGGGSELRECGVDQSAIGGGEGDPVEAFERLEMRGAACADQQSRHAVLIERPTQRDVADRCLMASGDRVQCREQGGVARPAIGVVDDGAVLALALRAEAGIACAMPALRDETAGERAITVEGDAVRATERQQCRHRAAIEQRELRLDAVHVNAVVMQQRDRRRVDIHHAEFADDTTRTKRCECGRGAPPALRRKAPHRELQHIEAVHIE